MWTSLAVLLGAVGVWLGYPLADAIVGLLITVAILGIVRQSGKTIFTWLLDGVDPEVIGEIQHAAGHVPGVEDVAEVKARWLGHELYAEVSVAVAPELSVAGGTRRPARSTTGSCKSCLTCAEPWCTRTPCTSPERSTTASQPTPTTGYRPTLIRTYAGARGS